MIEMNKQKKDRTHNGGEIKTKRPMVVCQESDLPPLSTSKMHGLYWQRRLVFCLHQRRALGILTGSLQTSN